jgi:TPR repeat protein
MHNLAWAYGRGQGVEPDSAKYHEWEKKAALAYYAESKTADPKDIEDKIGSAVHAVLCYADGPSDAEVIALFSQMRTDPRVQEYAAKRYSATPSFLDDLEKRLKGDTK